jgi:hypothetical protein
MLGIADGVGCFTLASFDGVEEHGHIATVIG